MTHTRHATLTCAARKAVCILASVALSVSMLGIPAFADTGEAPESLMGNEEGFSSSAESASSANATSETGIDAGAGSEDANATEEESETSSDSDDQAPTEEGEEGSGGMKLSTSEEAKDYTLVQSAIFIDVTDARPFLTDTPPVFLVSLSSRGLQQTIPMERDGRGYYGSYTYDNVAPGKYTVTVTADRFASYVQKDIVVEEGPAHTYIVRISTWGQQAGEGVSQSGAMYYGDVDGDGALTEADVDKMVGMLDSGTTAEEVPECDLTGSGDISLADLQVLAEGYGAEEVLSEASPKLMVTGVSVSDNVTILSDGSSNRSIQDVSKVVGNPDERSSLKMSAGQDISAANPITMVLDHLDDQLLGEGVGCITIKQPLHVSADGAVTPHPHGVTGGYAEVIYVDENGKDQPINVRIGDEEASGPIEQAAMFLGLLPQKAYAAEERQATFDAAGNIVIDFGRKVAIKKVTLTITKTRAEDGNYSLAEISSVEFLNGTEELIAPPELNIPKDLVLTPGSKQFTVSWKGETNVTGYEVSVMLDGNEQLITTKNTTLLVDAFKYGPKGKVENGKTYTVKVQSTNGTWRSGWSEARDVTPETTKVPDKPETVKASGGYKFVNVSWKAMEDTDFYIVHWRKEGESAWQTTSDGSNSPSNQGKTLVTGSSYQISGLEDRTAYEIYVTGKNQIGESAPSATVGAETTTIAPAELPTYKLVNTKDANGHYLTGIQTARVISASMVDSKLDANAATALGLFDDDYTSYAKKADWDLGCSYNAGSHGVEVTFDGVKEIGFISYAASSQNIDYSGVVVHASTNGSAWERVPGVSFTQQKCANGRTYTFIKISGGLRADKILIGMNRYPRLIDIAEMRFHGYDSIEDDVNALFADEMHIKLVDGVDEAKLEQLDSRLNTPDADGNYYPHKNIVQLELDFAKQLLADENAGLSEVIKIHTDISPGADSGKNLGIGGLNSWQPLGKVAAGGDQLIMYAACRNVKSNSKVQLYVGQQYAESAYAPSYGGTFPTGQRVIYPVPDKISDKGKEHGGPLYAQYTGNNPQEEWYVRIMGGHDIPVLDLHDVTDHEQRLALAEDYISELDETIALLDRSKADESAHRQAHLEESKLVVDNLEQDTINPSVDCDYNERNCIHNATELVTDTMMYSVPATQAARACTGDSLSERAATLISHMDGSEQMMKLFYQHKGLMEPGAGVAKTNEISAQHLNIRCMVMFAGAFMYAAGNHIGVDYPQAGNFCILSPISEAATAPGGTRQSGDGYYFGWGTAHEIGHNINNSRYAYAEVTNNYFAQLCKMINDGTTRFNYDTVYERVTSGATGRTGSVFTQLAMYWQLMLVNDLLPNPNNQVYTLYSDYDALQANRFFARVDGYARNPEAAPQAGLVCNGGESQNIIRLASAAANKDLTDFFTSWGLVPNAETKRYISQYEPETRALQYANDDAIQWARTHTAAPQVKDQDMVSVSLAQDGSEVTLSLGSKDAAYADSLIGYEITRYTYAQGKSQGEVIGFARAGADGSASFTDDATYLGNRAVHYEVKAVDKFLNYSIGALTEQKKLDGNGRLTPTEWTVETNLVQTGGESDEGDITEPAEGEEPECPAEAEAVAPKAIDAVLDGSQEFVGATQPGESTPAPVPSVLIDMKRVNEVASIRYTPGERDAIGAYTIESSVNGLNFTKIAEGEFSLKSEGYAEVFFTGKNDSGSPTNWICTEQARYIRITAPSMAGKPVSIREINVFGPSGDNIDFTSVAGEDDIQAIGRLTADFQLEAGDPTKVIPKDSILFTGAVKGNPAYNVVVLYDENGLPVGGSTLNADGEEVINAEQVLLAELPDGSLIGDTAEGRWVYWIAPDAQLPSKVRAELYRVNDALTNEGERLVADTVFVSVPENLPGITLRSDAQGQ